MTQQANSLIQKYNVPGPRYTSYPTVPYWDDATFSAEAWQQTLKRSFDESNASEGISLYIHLPFCESLCTFCGCHKRVTKRHEVEQPYIQALLKEWDLYCQLLESTPIIKEIHLGGGTPTFFSVEHLTQLIQGIPNKNPLIPPHKPPPTQRTHINPHATNPTQRKLQGGLHTSQRSRRPQHTNKPAGFQPRVPDTKNNKLPSRNKPYSYRDWETDRKSTRLNSSHRSLSRMPSSA